MFSKAISPRTRAGFLSRFARRPRDRDRLGPLYRAVVAHARDPFWYRDGRVPDSVGGRFDMLAAMMAMVLIRFEAEDSEEAKLASVMLTELFVDDMDESLHQIGIGDYVVGKHVGRMMGALGGRLAAFREAAENRDFITPVRRNIYHENPPDEAAAERVAERLERFGAALLAAPFVQLVDGGLPPL